MINNFCEILCLNDYNFFIEKNIYSESVIMKQWHKKKRGYQHLGSHFAEITNMFQIMYSKNIQNYKELPLDVSDSIMELQSAQMGVLISPDKIFRKHLVCLKHKGIIKETINKKVINNHNI